MWFFSNVIIKIAQVLHFFVNIENEILLFLILLFEIDLFKLQEFDKLLRLWHFLWIYDVFLQIQNEFKIVKIS